MEYRVISADCHIDLPWLPPDLFTANASQALKGRMPYVTDGDKGPVWVSGNGGAVRQNRIALHNPTIGRSQAAS